MKRRKSGPRLPAGPKKPSPKMIRGSTGKFSEKTHAIFQKIIVKIRRGEVKKVNMDNLIVKIYEETGELVPPETAEKYLKTGRKNVKIVFGQIGKWRSKTSGLEDICKTILIAWKVDFSKTKMKFSDGWTYDLEAYFRKHGKFPVYDSFSTNYGASFAKDGFDNFKRQIVEYYWSILKGK